MKKKRMMWILVLFSSLVLIGACSDKNKVTKMPSETETSKESLGSTYGFSFFSLIIDTKDMKEALNVNYEEKRDLTDAMYENKIDELYLYGNKAMKKLDTIFNDLSLEPDMDDEDLIKEVAKAFEISDYKMLELKIKFKGHDKKELMMTK